MVRMHRINQLAKTQRGFTFIEVVVVIIILGILLTVATSNIDSALEVSRHQEAEKELTALSHAIAGNPELISAGMRSDFGYVGDVGALPGSLTDLVTAPGGYATWSGPYIRDDFVENTSDYVTDPWGAAYSYTGSVTIQSIGSGATVTAQVANSATALLSNTVRGTTLDRNGAAPGDSASSVQVSLTYPDGAGSTTTTTVNPNRSGAFSFNGIPVGNHSLQAVYTSLADTAAIIVSVLPTVGSYIDALRFGDAHWSDTTISGGGGDGGGGIEYVAGTAAVSGAQSNNVIFDITNTSGADIIISSLIANFSLGSTFFKIVDWEGTNVFSNNSDKAASGDLIVFTSPQTITAGSTVTITLEQARDQEGAGGSSVAIPSNSDFTVELSDGAIISFTAL